MASRKEYEMLFALNARMNGGFSGTFSKAQAEFSRLGKEVQELQRLQGDISSYQKQQSAIESTRSKLENLQKQHDLLQKEINETTGETTGLEREKLKLEQRIKDTEAALGRQEQRLETTSARLKEAGVDTSNLSQKDAELTAKIKELRAEQDKAADSAADFGARATQAFDAIEQAVITSYIVDGLTAIKDAFVECVGVAGDLEETMSTVEALSGANARDMAALTEEAKDLGATSAFTAKQSAQAMTYMAMAGWDAQEMLSGMSGVINLAAASGEDLAQVSDIVTDNLTAFGLTAADTARFADILAATATRSNTSVSIMGETFKNAASVAGALGYSVEDVSVAVGLMANAGVKGSVAGTALKNTFNGLLEGATLTSRAFGEFEFTAVRADGTMKSFSDTINELRVYFDQMTEAERVNNAMALAGQRGYNGLLAVLNATDEDYASLTNSINNCTGAAQRMANIKLDNMNGQLTLMNSAWDALKTTIGEQFIPEMRTLYEVGTDVFSGLNEFVKANPGVVKGIAAGAAVIGTVTLALTAYAAGAKIAAAASALLSASIPGVNIIMGVTAAVAGITAAVVALTTAADDGVPSVKELTEAARDMQDAMEEAGATYEKTATQTLATAEVAGIYIDKLEEIEAATNGATQGNQEYHNILALLTRTVPELADDINLTTDSINGGTEALRQHAEAWKKDAETQAYQEYINSLYDQYGAVMAESAENSIKLTQAQIQLQAANQKVSDTYARLDELWAEASQKAQESYEEYGLLYDASVYLTQEYYDLQNSLIDLNDEIYTTEKTITNLNKAIDEDADAVAAAEAEIESAQEAVNQLTGATEEQTEAEIEAARQTEQLNAVIGDTMEQIASLAAAYEDAYNAAYDSISGQYDLWDQAEKVVATSAGSINQAMESQIAYWQEYNANLEALGERTGDIEGLSDLIASFADGSTESVNAIAGMAQASDEDLAAMVANWKTLQEEQDAAAGSIADLQTNFTETMDELQQALAEDIKEMDLGNEAANSGKATIQGYIDGAESMLPQVQAAYSKLARAAQSALTTASSGGRVYVGGGVYVNAYASGTRNAERGFAMVGEDGPEIVYFNGGEQVLNASQTAALRATPAMQDSSGGGGNSYSFAPSYNISGATNAAELETVLRQHDEDLHELFLGWLEEVSVEEARRSYR